MKTAHKKVRVNISKTREFDIHIKKPRGLAKNFNFSTPLRRVKQGHKTPFI